MQSFKPDILRHWSINVAGEVRQKCTQLLLEFLRSAEPIVSRIEAVVREQVHAPQQVATTFKMHVQLAKSDQRRQDEERILGRSLCIK